MPEPSKYAENQFLSATEGNLTLMGEFLADTLPRVVQITLTQPAFTSIRDELISLVAAYNAMEAVVANQEALLPSRTLAFEDKIASLTRKPDLETNSLLDVWDNTIGAQVAYGGTVYTYLLPQGRQTLTAGTYEQQLDAGAAFGIRLGEQTAKPVLVALKTPVDAFFNDARTKRTAQNSTKNTLAQARRDLEDLRQNAAAALYALAGTGMTNFRGSPLSVDLLYNINILRDPPQFVPAPPADTAWDAPARTLSTTALPPGATRLEAWRLAPGSVPELLEIGDPGALSVIIPALYTFDPGDLYQLWLQARNAKGSSTPGPVVNWTA